MNKLTIKNIFTVVTYLALAGNAFAQATSANDSVAWDDRASQWVYTLHNPSGNGQSAQIRYTPRTVIDPKVKSTLRWRNENFEYSYRIRNGNSAKQEISDMEVRTPSWNMKPIIQLAPVQGETQAQMQIRGKINNEKYDQFEKQTLDAPSKWAPFLRTKRPERVYFGWYARSSLDNEGIKPNHTADGFKVTRPELPGAALMAMKGYTKDFMNEPSLPTEGAMAEHAADVLTNNTVDVPVLVPAIIVPSPYNGAELARRVKAHVATWINLELIEPEKLAVLNPKLDQLIAALEQQNKQTIHAAAVNVLQETFILQRGLHHEKIDNDDDNEDPQAINLAQVNSAITMKVQPVENQPLNRVAARALAFDVMYLLTRAYTGK
jgi:hypothetical protein